MGSGSFFRVLGKYFQKHLGREPSKPLGPFRTDPSLINNPPSKGLRITWLGHSSTLIEIDGKRFLTDPLWYNRVSPFSKIGPKRFFNNPLSIASLPSINAILLSHDHYDHLDKKSILFLVKEKGIPVITMLGVGQRLINWGLPKEKITELDWWENKKIEDITITAAPARHFSGRWLNDRFKTLWGSFALRSPHHALYYGADSGYFDGFKTIGERLGPFDLTMLEIGAYNEEWEAIHMGPEGAVQAQKDLGRGLLLPIHWGTFSLAFHSWKEPVERIIEEANKEGVQLLLPRPGETIDILKGAYNSRWWEEYD